MIINFKSAHWLPSFVHTDQYKAVFNQFTLLRIWLRSNLLLFFQSIRRYSKAYVDKFAKPVDNLPMIWCKWKYKLAFRHRFYKRRIDSVYMYLIIQFVFLISVDRAIMYKKTFVLIFEWMKLLFHFQTLTVSVAFTWNARIEMFLSNVFD